MQRYGKEPQHHPGEFAPILSDAETHMSDNRSDSVLYRRYRSARIKRILFWLQLTYLRIMHKWANFVSRETISSNPLNPTAYLAT